MESISSFICFDIWFHCWPSETTLAYIAVSEYPLSDSILQDFALYLCAAYLCICLPVNSQFKYLSNIPCSQYRASCQTCPLETAINSMLFCNSRSRSLTYDNRRKWRAGVWENMGGGVGSGKKVLLIPYKFATPSLPLAWEPKMLEIQMFKINSLANTSPRWNVPWKIPQIWYIWKNLPRLNILFHMWM